MRWEAWVLISFFVTSSLLSVGSVGKPRTPLTPGQSVAGLILGGLLTVLVVRLGT